MAADIAADAARATDECTVVMGDWNFLHEDEDAFVLDGEREAVGVWRRVKGTRRKRPGEVAFGRALASALEIAQPSPTQFCAAAASASRLDRIWVGVPSWVFQRVRVVGGVWGVRRHRGGGEGATMSR